MHLWTFQKPGTAAFIAENGVYHCDADKAETLKALQAETPYTWLAEQMTERIGNAPKGVKYPVWAWYMVEGENKRPDARKLAFRHDEDCELLELEVPDDQVLLSDYDTWHFVLNDSYLDNSTNEEEYDHEHEWFDSLPRNVQERTKRESWKRIFDIRKVDTDWIKNGFYVQATFWEIRKEWLKKVDTLKGYQNRNS